MLKNKSIYLLLIIILIVVIWFVSADDNSTTTQDSNSQTNSISNNANTTTNNSQTSIDNSQSNNTAKELPPNFPKPLAPLDEAKLQEMDNLITEGDEIISNMEALLSEIDLPELNEKEIAELEQNKAKNLEKLKELEEKLNNLELENN